MLILISTLILSRVHCELIDVQNQSSTFENVSYIINKTYFDIKTDDFNPDQRHCIKKILNTSVESHEIYVVINKSLELQEFLHHPFYIVQYRANYTRTQKSCIKGNYFLIISSPSVLKDILTFLNDSCFWNTRAKIVVVLNKLSKPESVLQQLWAFNISNVIMLDLNSMNIFAWSPFNENQCGRKFIYHQFNCYALNTTKDLFIVAKKFTGCSIRAAYFRVAYDIPYMANGSGIGVAERSFGFVMEGLGINVLYEPIGDEKERELLSQHTLEDPIYFNFDVIFPIVTRFVWIYTEYDASEIYLFDDYLWVIAKPQQLPNTQVMAVIFSTNVWIAAIATYILSAICWYFLNNAHRARKTGLTTSFLDIIRLSLTFSIPKTPESMFRRFFFILYILFSFVLSSAFLGKYSSVLTHPGHEKSIESVEEMANSLITPIFFGYIWNILKELNFTVTKNIVDKSVVVDWSIQDRQKKVVGGGFCTPLYRMSLEYSSQYNERLKPIGSDYLISMNSVLNFKKGTKFLEQIDVLIGIMHQGGFQKKWLKDLLKKNSTIEDSIITITFEHCDGAFYFLGVGVALSVVVFVIELIIGKLWK